MPINESNQNALDVLANLSGGNGRKHSVPQNVMDVEFKVVGDLTLRQLGYILLGGMGGYVFYNSGLPSFWAITLGVISVSLGLAIAFLPIEERPLDKWLVLFVRAMFKETQLIWKKSSVIPAYFLSDYTDIIKNEIITLTPIKNRNKLDEYLGLLGEDLDNLDIYQSDNISKISTTMEARLQTPAKLATEAKSLAPKREEMIKDEMRSKMELLEMNSSVTGTLNSSTTPTTLETSVVVDRPIKNWPKKYESQVKGDMKIHTTAKLPPLIVAEDIKEIKEQEISLEKKIEELMNVASHAKSEMEAKGLNLETSDRIEYFRNKYHELKQEKESLKTELEKNTSRVNQIDEEHKKKDLETLVTQLTKQNEDLEQKLQVIQDQLFILRNSENKQQAHQTTEEQKPAIQIPEELLQKSNINYMKPTQQIMPDKLPSELLRENKTQQQNQSLQTNEPPKLTNDQKSANEYSEITDKMIKTGKDLKILDQNNQNNNLQQKPNVNFDNIIYGTVKDHNGMLSENTVVLIKDERGEVIRALKTNKLGQFKTQTPLPNAIYFIEALKGGEVFDIIRVEAKGQKLNPVYLIGKPKS
jgi:hypothetical protein